MLRGVRKSLYPRNSPSIAKGVNIIRGCDINDSLAGEGKNWISVYVCMKRHLKDRWK